jgi:hypothetical protein
VPRTSAPVASPTDLPAREGERAANATTTRDLRAAVSGRWRGRTNDTEPRILGIPRSWWGANHADFRGLGHPLQWTRWRADVRRRGPYAPRFEITPRRKKDR